MRYIFFLYSMFYFHVCFSQVEYDKYIKEGYKLVWADEFNDNILNVDNWWIRNDDWERDAETYWDNDNVILKDGLLIMQIDKVKGLRVNKYYDPNSLNLNFKKKYIDYTSASIVSKNRKEWMYGRFVIRAKFDITNGTWPSFWSVGKNIDSVGWPKSGEIDIFEYFNNLVMSNIIYSTDNNESTPFYNSKYKTLGKELQKNKWSNEFHEWIMDWDEKYIRIYLDNELINELNLNEITDKEGYNPFRQPHFFFLEFRGGGENARSLNTNDSYPKKMVVDYIRIYQKKNNGL